MRATTLRSFTSCAAWVAWAHAMRRGAPTKIPFDPKTGRPAATDNPATWATYPDALQWARENNAAGVGLMLGPLCDNNHVNGIDLDLCRDKLTGEIAEWGHAVVDRFASYTEISPSETGVKLLFTTDPADAGAVESLFGGQFGRV
jgi:putative DNA primase/helicase